ncbi:MAG TPA: glycosyltransferase family 2 protein [Candidatus Udaeobacter sp.]|jgi:dolichol-phosphate mannosyltransferase|nr:glycosyltransferase family 2 protein [Candidatus Udaeobacter sp.]
MDRPELSVVIPFLNEEQVLPLLRERLDKIRKRSAAWELLFVSDGSTDGSTRFIEDWASEDPSVKLIVLTRNFGHQNAVSAGLSFASGNHVAIMDADLQDEPEILLEMYRTLMTDKVDVVYAIRTSRSEPRFKRFLYFVFYRLYLYLADSPVQADSGDFCVMSRRAVGLLLNLPEKQRFVRGLRTWIGLPSRPFPIARPARAAGAPQYSLTKLTKLAFSGLTSFSTRPLRVGFVCGSILCAGAVIGALAYLAIALFTDIHVAAPGFSTLVIVLLFSNGLIFLYLGILGEYIGQMFMEVKRRPSFIVERTINLERTQGPHARD